MVGIVIVAHGNLSQEFINTTELITGDGISNITGISIHPDDSAKKVADKITSSIKEVDSGDGVLILTDMFGGTPSNISLSFLEAGKVEVVSGVNLPMLVHIAFNREGVSLEELGLTLQNMGRENISLASEILKGPGEHK